MNCPPVKSILLLMKRGDDLDFDVQMLWCPQKCCLELLLEAARCGADARVTSCDNGWVPRVMCNAVINYKTKQERLKISLVYERNVITM